jgi:hypothetical protein
MSLSKYPLHIVSPTLYIIIPRWLVALALLFVFSSHYYLLSNSFVHSVSAILGAVCKKVNKFFFNINKHNNSLELLIIFSSSSACLNVPSQTKDNHFIEGLQNKMLSLSIVGLALFAPVVSGVHVENALEWRKRPYHKHFGKHNIPYETEFANEMFVVHGENIETAAASSDLYIIEDISPLVIDNDDVVTVTYFSNAPNSKAYGDWIGAYSPANADIRKTVPVKYGWCDEDPDYETSGYGSLHFNLTNLRADVAFYYFTSGTIYPKFVNVSQTNVTFTNYNQPLRPRVVATGDYDMFNLLWSSSTSTQPQVKWGTSKGNYIFTADAVTSKIEASDMFGYPANSTGFRDFGLIHTAPLVGMKALANTKLYYIFGDAATNDFSDEFLFNVPPLPGACFDTLFIITNCAHIMLVW